MGANVSANCSCSHFDTCVNDPRAEQVVINSSNDVEPGHFTHFSTPRAIARGRDTDPVAPREDGGLCIGELHGRAGTIRYQNGDVYTGEWRDKQAMGYGRVVRPDGSTFEGQWASDAAHGEGVETFPDSSWYRGGYHKGVKTGFGTLHWSTGPEFCGQFEDNVFHGEGTYLWGDGRSYTGQWKRNEFHGYGRMAWPDGQVYDGQYDVGKKDGEGMFIWADGRRYSGRWKDGKQNGMGAFQDEKGNQRPGLWEVGRRVRWLTEAERDELAKEGAKNQAREIEQEQAKTKAALEQELDRAEIAQEPSAIPQIEPKEVSTEKVDQTAADDDP